ncbi:hypothetical protein SK128_009927 [Halocaridina rubra]|uniref:Uncharacterized protein n=1 Tax=Halocaridina rubra TaxID=373956 RepID=A0AAN9A3D6_HALRR
MSPKNHPVSCLLTFGDEIDGNETHWLRYMTGCQQIGVHHVIVSGGRPPTAIPSPPESEERSSNCALM